MNIFVTLLGILSFLVVLTSFSKITTLSLTKLNYYSFLFIYNISMLSFVGVFLILNGWNKDDVVNIIDDQFKFWGAFVIFSCLVLFALALKNISTFLKIDKNYVLSFISSPPIASDKNVFLFIAFLSVIVSISIVYFFFNLEVVPILEVIRSKGLNVTESALLRTLAVFELPIIMNFIRLSCTPLCQIFYFYFLAEFLIQKKKKLLILVLLQFACSFAMLIYGGDKAPVVMFIFGHMFFFILFNGQVRKRVLITSSLVAFALMVVLYLAMMRGLSDSVYEAFLNRLFVSQISGTFLSFQHYGNIEPFIGFSSQSASLFKVFGFDSVLRACERLVEYYFYNSYKNGYFKNMNSLFLQEAWANYGILGLIISPFWIALLIMLNFKLLTSFGKSSVAIAFLTFFSYENTSFSTSFNAFIFSIPYLIIISIFLCASFVKNRFMLSRRVL